MPDTPLCPVEEPVALSPQAVQRLLDRGDGDAALLYLALRRHRQGTAPRSLAGELRWDRGRIEAAEAALRELGLLAGPPPLPPESADEPAAYRQEDIAGALEEDPAFARLTAEVERRLGKKLSTAGVSTLLGLYDDRRLPADVIYLLVCHCAQRAEEAGPGRKPTLRQIEKEGYAWARMGIDSQEAAAAHLRRYAESRKALPGYMEALRLGRDRPPSASEEKYLLQWQAWGFGPEAAALAYDKTVLRCHEFKWNYCNGILRRWHEAGLHTVEQIEERDARPAPKRAEAAEAAGKSGGNAWMRAYIQRRKGEE